MHYVNRPGEQEINLRRREYFVSNVEALLPPSNPDLNPPSLMEPEQIIGEQSQRPETYEQHWLDSFTETQLIKRQKFVKVSYDLSGLFLELKKEQNPVTGTQLIAKTTESVYDPGYKYRGYILHKYVVDDTLEAASHNVTSQPAIPSSITPRSLPSRSATIAESNRAEMDYGLWVFTNFDYYRVIDLLLQCTPERKIRL